MKDVEKTDVERQNSSKRLRRRKRNFNIYAAVVVLLAVTVGLTISYTFLFNINEIKVSGESDMYTAEQIVDASGIKEGDNLLRLDPKKSEQEILDKLLYVETAEVDRDFPSSLEITVTRCVPAYNISYDNGVLLVSKKGKILADNGFITDGLPVIYGYEPSVKFAGKSVDSENQHKADAFSEFMASIDMDFASEIASVDMSDEFSIVVNYKNGMVFRMGNWSDVNYKLELASNVMSDDSVKGKKGYLTMVGANQCSFRMNKTGDKLITPEQPTTEPKTDANGKPIDGESNPEQEAIFEHYNQNRPADQQQQQQDPQPQPGQNGGNDNNAYNNNNEYNNGYGNDGGNAYGNNDYADGYNNGYGNDYGGYDANGGYGGADYGNGYGGGYDQYVGGGQNY